MLSRVTRSSGSHVSWPYIPDRPGFTCFSPRVWITLLHNKLGAVTGSTMCCQDELGSTVFDPADAQREGTTRSPHRQPGSEQIQQRFQLPCWLVTLLQYMYSRQEYCCALRPMLSIACSQATHASPCTGTMTPLTQNQLAYNISCARHLAIGNRHAICTHLQHTPPSG